MTHVTSHDICDINDICDIYDSCDISNFQANNVNECLGKQGALLRGRMGI